MRRALLTLLAIAAPAIFPAGAAASPSAATTPALAGGSASQAGVAASVASKARARKRALRRCRKISKRPKRKRCIRKVRRKYAARAVQQHGPIAETIDVRDKYFSPAIVSIRTGQSILWVWNAVNADAHNVDLVRGPKGVDRLAFSTPSSPSVGFQFRRTFTVPGTYDFVCSIHYNMTMRVEVQK